MADTALDTDRLDAVLGRFVADLGATAAAPDIVAGDGFRRAAQTPFNLVDEVRP